MPVQGGVRYAAYRSMAVVIRYLQPHHAAAALGVPVLPLLFNEALLALGNRVSLHPLNTKRHAPVRRRWGKLVLAKMLVFLVDFGVARLMG